MGPTVCDHLMAFSGVVGAIHREAVADLQATHGLSERRTCRIVGADRKMVRYQAQRALDTVLRERPGELVRANAGGSASAFQFYTEA
ncbi:MAG TPA: hypothetical protein GX700_11005 [Paracoccus sp.]|nr:hypothetical protein [Paracoccus sp. (in: a-proteobacteria)]